MQAGLAWHRHGAVLLLCFCLAFQGCGGTGIVRKSGESTARPYALGNIAKSDVDLVSELAQREVLRGLRRITEKLYRRNPQEYRKAGFDAPEPAADRLFGQVSSWAESPLACGEWAESLRLTFAEGYEGDRVYAFMSALTSMVMASYGHRTEFFLLDELDAQKLYNSARNLETVAWKLARARKKDGTPFLLSNETEGNTPNLSFEREFGKLIAEQDLLALIIEDKGNRAITRTLHNVASFVLLPI